MMNSKTTHENSHRLSWPKRIAFAIIPVLLLIIGTEGFLWLCGYDSPVADPYESFVLRHPLFVQEGNEMVTAPPRRKFFHLQRFSKTKPENTRRIFIFGGSTTYGWGLPDPQRNSYVHQLGELLKSKFPDTNIEMINCGGLSYASYRLVDLVEESVAYSPDLVIVMSGHNEFIEERHYDNLIGPASAFKRLWFNFRTVRLIQHLSNLYSKQRRPKQPVLGDDPPIFDTSTRYMVCNDDELRSVYEHYVSNINRIVTACKVKDIPIILCTCPSNLLNFPPTYTPPPPTMKNGEFVPAINQAISLYETGAPQDALAIVQGILADDPKSAISHYIAGLCFYRMKKFEKAKNSLILAKDTDALQGRAITLFNDYIRSVANEKKISLFDGEAVFFASSDHGIPGANLFLDSCHPTVDGHRLFAEGLNDIASNILRDFRKIKIRPVPGNAAFSSKAED